MTAIVFSNASQTRLRLRSHPIRHTKTRKMNTPHTAHIAHDKALEKVMQTFLKDDTEVYKQFVENESFKRFVGDMVYAITNQ